MKTRPRAEAREAYVRDLPTQLGRVASALVFCRSKGQEGRTHQRIAKVPEWVAYSAYSKAELLAPQVVPVPRFVLVRQEVAPPISLQGVPRYSKVGKHRRAVLDTVMGSSKEVLEAMYECECCLDRLDYRYQAYITGSIGVNKPMRETAEDLRMCWAVQHMVCSVQKSNTI